jgi:hypothetical protein
VGHSDRLRLNGPVKAFKVTPLLGLSTHHAVDAEAWLLEREGELPGKSISLRLKKSTFDPPYPIHLLMQNVLLYLSSERLYL